MSEYYHIVPWFDSAEWLKVYNLIYSPNSTLETKQEALKQLLVWKARCPSLPSGVQSTLTLLEVHIHDAKLYENAINDHSVLRLAYSSAIMRFVNHMLDTETARGSSLYQAAKNLGVPDWIIDMRHDTAHSNNLPSIEILRDACSISLNWLQKFYWEKHKMCIKDYVAGQKETNVNDENKIAILMNYCVSLSICTHSRCKIKNLSEIPDATMRESIANDVRDLFGDSIDLSNLKTVSIMSLVNAINMQSKKLLRTADIVTYVNKALLGEDSLFLSMELLNAMDENEFYHKKHLNRSYVQCFEFMLTFLHSHDLLLDFLMELIKISYSNSDNDRSCLAALWVSEILIALRKSKQFIDRIKKTSTSDFDSKKRKDLKLLFHHWFPNEKVYGLLLDLQKPVPKELMDLNFIRPIISCYNVNLTYFVRDLLNLVVPNLPKPTMDKICKLAKTISSTDSFSSVSTKIYTVDDLKKAQEHSMDDNNDSDCQIYEDVEMSENNNAGRTAHGIWHLASNDFNWSACPVGLLPWQQRTNEAAQVDT